MNYTTYQRTHAVQVEDLYESYANKNFSLSAFVFIIKPLVLVQKDARYNNHKLSLYTTIKYHLTIIYLIRLAGKIFISSCINP